MVCCFAVCVCSFSRVVFALGDQEGEDASFSAENYLFFLSGNDRGMIKQAVMVTVVSYLYSLDKYCITSSYGWCRINAGSHLVFGIKRTITILNV